MLHGEIFFSLCGCVDRIRDFVKLWFHHSDSFHKCRQLPQGAAYVGLAMTIHTHDLLYVGFQFAMCSVETLQKFYHQHLLFCFDFFYCLF